MKVVVVPHAYWPSIGGAERYAQGQAEGLVKLGHEVHVVVANVDDPEAFYEIGHGAAGSISEIIGGVQVHRVPFSTVRYRNFGRFGRERALSSAISRFEVELELTLSGLGPDVVVTLPHLFPNVEPVLQLRSASSWKLVYVPMLHEDDPYWSVSRVAVAVRKADGVIALTQHELERLLESYGAKPQTTVVIPPGVSVQALDSSVRQPVVVFVGRRTVSKRLDVLYEAMKIVWQTYPETRLVVAGSPPSLGLDPAVWMAGDPRVRVVDSPSESEKGRLLATARVAVSPSLAESFGITTLEAWAHGTPVVVTDSPVNRSVVRDGVDGLLTAGSDPSALAESLSSLLGSPDLAESLGREGRARLQTEFSWSSAVTALDRLIRSV